MPTDLQAIKLQDLRERWQRLNESVRQMRKQYDLETRVEERMRVEPRIEEQERERDQVEAEIKALEASGSQRPGPPRLFYSYSHKDEALRDELAKHLKILERQNVLDSWHDRDIAPGADWDRDISQNLLDADIILLLVSVDFMASDYIWGKELKVALERHEKGEARVIPVILRETDWIGGPFSHLQALPRDGRPVSSFSSNDEAFAAIAREIRAVVLEMAKG